MLNVKKLEKGLVEIQGEIEYAKLEMWRAEALKHLGEHLSVDGFRPGHVPASVVTKHVSEMAVLEEMARLALAKEYAAILEEAKISPITYPSINITKLAAGNPLGFTLTVQTMPDLKLPDYKKIARDTAAPEAVEVTEADIAAVMKNMKVMRGREEKIEDETKIPDIDDEYVKKLGGFENLEDFKAKMKENILAEKTARANEKRRLAIMDGILSTTEFDSPEALVHAEAHKMLHRMRADIEAMGLNYDDYLKRMNKTEADLEKEFHTDAAKRVKLQIVVGKIAEVEKLRPSKDAIEAELARVLANYKDADPESARAYIESVLANEEVFKFLETQK